MDHANLPSINSAKLPETYQAAKIALANCADLDECQSWADKAEALASYAKQAKDDGLRKMADRIQARAIRRAGELLKQIPASKGGDPSLFNAQEGAHPSVTRTQAAEEAGLSEWQRKTAIRVANVPDGEFENAVESSAPPTITQLAERGKKTLIDLKGRDPKEFNTALHFIAKFRSHLKDCKEYDISHTVEILTVDERKSLRSLINEIDSIHDQIMTRI
jgi:hypothetical protein